MNDVLEGDENLRSPFMFNIIKLSTQHKEKKGNINKIGYNYQRIKGGKKSKQHDTVLEMHKLAWTAMKSSFWHF